MQENTMQYLQSCSKFCINDTLIELIQQESYPELYLHEAKTLIYMKKL